MTNKIFESVIIFLFYFISINAQRRRTEIVYTAKGPVRGEIVQTVQNNISFSAFEGIPYAKPPLGKLRFKPPVEIDSWTGLYESIEGPPGCPQRGTKEGIFGDEDCLFVNVYTPKINFSSNEDDLKAVMVWIHGGYYLYGVVDDSNYGPDFLIEEDVVLVYVSYRLGPLGFLSLNHPNATGNAGLKDQVLALKWVQQNVKYFGGDPDKVTIFGQSVGSVAVELHSMSEMSRGLFHRSISMSGSPLNYWAFTGIHWAEVRAFTLAAHLGIITIDKDELLEKLYVIPAKDIVAATSKMLQMDLPFEPTLEDETLSDNIFLSKCAFRRYEEGSFNNLPHILGFVDSETLGMIAGYIPGYGYHSLNTKSSFFSFGQDKENEEQPGIVGLSRLAQADYNPESNVETIDYPDFPELNQEEEKSWFNFDLFGTSSWFNFGLFSTSSNPILRYFLQITTKITTDILFVMGIDQVQHYRSQKNAPIYYYRNSFDYSMSQHKVEGVDVDGVAHGDDLLHIFWMPNLNQSLNPFSVIGIHRKRMVKMWSNFAKYANPTPDGKEDLLLNVTWIPSGSEGTHLEIDNVLTLKSRPVGWLAKLAIIFGKPIELFYGGCMFM